MDQMFSYTYDATGLYQFDEFLDQQTCERLRDALDDLHWGEAEFVHTLRIEELHRRSDVMLDLAQSLLRHPLVQSTMTHPARLIESYSLSRLPGGELPMHGGSLEHFRHFGLPEATDISCAYLFRAGHMYSMRVKALIYLDDIVSPEDGPLFYIEGSHKENYSFFDSFRQDHLMTGFKHLVRPVMVRQGTCLILNEALVHGAFVKTSSSPRRLLVFTFGPTFVTNWRALSRSDSDLERSGYIVPDTEDAV
jgi:hypothetical protein